MHFKLSRDTVHILYSVVKLVTVYVIFTQSEPSVNLKFVARC